MDNQPSTPEKTVRALAEMAIKSGKGETGLQGSFKAVEIGLGLAGRALRITDPNEKEFEAWRLEQDLKHFNESPHSSRRLYSYLRESEILSDNQVGGFVGVVLKDHSAELIKNAAALVLNDQDFEGKNENEINNLLNQIISELKVISEKMGVSEGQIAPGKERK